VDGSLVRETEVSVQQVVATSLVTLVDQDVPCSVFIPGQFLFITYQLLISMRALALHSSAACFLHIIQPFIVAVQLVQRNLFIEKDN
jgi:hypothetical protein